MLTVYHYFLNKPDKMENGQTMISTLSTVLKHPGKDNYLKYLLI